MGWELSPAQRQAAILQGLPHGCAADSQLHALKRSSRLGLHWPPGHAVFGVRLGSQADARGQREHTCHSNCHSAHFNDSCCGERVLEN